MSPLSHRWHPADVYEAADRLREHAEGPERTATVAVSDLILVLSQAYWAAPEWHDPALVHLTYVQWVLGRLNPGDRRRVVAWIIDEYGEPES